MRVVSASRRPASAPRSTRAPWRGCYWIPAGRLLATRSPPPLGGAQCNDSGPCRLRMFMYQLFRLGPRGVPSSRHGLPAASRRAPSLGLDWFRGMPTPAEQLLILCSVTRRPPQSTSLACPNGGGRLALHQARVSPGPVAAEAPDARGGQLDPIPPSLFRRTRDLWISSGDTGAGGTRVTRQGFATSPMPTASTAAPSVLSDLGVVPLSVLRPVASEGTAEAQTAHNGSSPGSV